MNINYISMLKLHNLLKAYQQEYACLIPPKDLLTLSQWTEFRECVKLNLKNYIFIFTKSLKGKLAFPSIMNESSKQLYLHMYLQQESQMLCITLQLLQTLEILFIIISKIWSLLEPSVDLTVLIIKDIYSHIKSLFFLGLPWRSRLCSQYRGPGLIPDQVAGSHILYLGVCVMQVKILHATIKTWHTQINESLF